jgi:hypothetical protein
MLAANGSVAPQQSGLMHSGAYLRPGRPPRGKSRWLRLNCSVFFAAATAVLSLVALALCSHRILLRILLTELPRGGLLQVGGGQQQELHQYMLSPLPVFGAAVQGINLSAPVPPDIAEQLKRDLLRCGRTAHTTAEMRGRTAAQGPAHADRLHGSPRLPPARRRRHRLLLFRDQDVTVGRHKEIGDWGAKIESMGQARHGAGLCAAEAEQGVLHRGGGCGPTCALHPGSGVAWMSLTTQATPPPHRSICVHAAAAWWQARGIGGPVRFTNMSNVQELGIRGQPARACRRQQQLCIPTERACRILQAPARLAGMWTALSRTRGEGARMGRRSSRLGTCQPSGMPACVLADQRPCCRCPRPDQVSLFYSHQTSRGAGTAFAPLQELLSKCARG